MRKTVADNAVHGAASRVAAQGTFRFSGEAKRLPSHAYPCSDNDKLLRQGFLTDLQKFLLLQAPAPAGRWEEGE